jgi:hypothetical protein
MRPFQRHTIVVVLARLEVDGGMSVGSTVCNKYITFVERHMVQWEQ